MNLLEKAIIEGANKAQKDYSKMTDGWWLSHGPESFFMCTIANYIAEKCKFTVYLEASPKKIMNERDVAYKDKAAVNQRFDIVVWQKYTTDVRAIIEVKRAWNISGLRNDRDKIATYMSDNDHVKTGYILVYTDAKGANREDTIARRLKNWTNNLNCKLVNKKNNSKGNGEYGWAVALFRLNS